MENSRTQNTSRSIAWGVINKIIAIILPFATRTVMIYNLGMQYVGLGSLFSSVLQVLSFAELGIGSALVFSMYKPIADEDDEKVCALLNLYKKAYRIIGLVVLVIGLLLMPVIRQLIAGDIPDDINIYMLYAIYLFNNVIGYFLFAYKQSLLTASQRVDIISKVGMLLQMISGIVQIGLLIIFKNYLLYVIVIPIVTCLNNVALGFITDKKYPQYKCVGSISNDEADALKKKVGGMIFQKIGGIILASVDTIVISAFLGLTQLALYQNYYYVFTALNAFFAVIQQAMIPSVGNSIAVNSIEKNYDDFKKFNFIYVWIVVWWSTCLMCLYQPFMEIWVGRENMLGYDMVLLFVAYFFIYKWCDMLYVYQDACGLWWQTRYVPFIASITNLVINIVLVKIIGLPGILISTIVAIAFIYDYGYARVIFNSYFKDIKKGLVLYWGRQFLYLVSLFVVVGISWLLCIIVPLENIVFRFLMNVVICVIIPNLLIVILWHKMPEFKGVIKLVKGIVNR